MQVCRRYIVLHNGGDLLLVYQNTLHVMPSHGYGISLTQAASIALALIHPTLRHFGTL
ncbi:hypothetical protein NBRC116593_12580 [Sulfitobacter pacificus]